MLLKVSISLGNLDVGLSIKIGVNLPPNLSYQTPLTSRVQVASCEKRRLKIFKIKKKLKKKKKKKIMKIMKIMKVVKIRVFVRLWLLVW